MEAISKILQVTAVEGVQPVFTFQKIDGQTHMMIKWPKAPPPPPIINPLFIHALRAQAQANQHQLVSQLSSQRNLLSQNLGTQMALLKAQGAQIPPQRKPPSEIEKEKERFGFFSQHLEEIYKKYDINKECIQGGSEEELLHPPLKHLGYRTESQIHLMRRMRYISNKLSLTTDTYPDYESAVSLILDSFAITKDKVDEESYRRKMNFLLRKRINNRRWFLKKKLNDENSNEEDRASKRMKTEVDINSHSSESKATNDSFDSPE
ncbi:Oidioi.mRNA.OKI2018_I69.chr2.g5703.t1.cds [Oikopleura dioica]|uniref:Oidioi.mRNA.OKI2018_I69.chr2.g5703.t1.cds n=1 Tax=Oikopleura dioica TaxID=34765 RepID=A0ABN7T2V3_OIKDI|nr:Oidioi.mRNA.OKI2018_I69.chr2.g5703.t1.cds [Oikopleura dioica]